MRVEGIEEATMLLRIGDLILKEAATLKRQGNIVKAQGHGLMAKVIGECEEKPDNVTQETWERHRCKHS